jgi:hypothetical protein
MWDEVVCHIAVAFFEKIVGVHLMILRRSLNDHYTFNIQCNIAITPILKISMFCSIFAMFCQEKYLSP